MSDDRSSLDPRIAAAFYGGFPELRPVQAAAIEPLVNGRNVVLSSGTGSGKTEAVTAPLLSRFWVEALRDERTVMLYIAPTKALINDIAKRLESVLQSLSLRVGIRHGDRNDLELVAKPHVLITTPESLNVMLRHKEPVLAEIHCVVIDEIHLLFNTQRGLHLAVLLWRLKRFAGRPIQWAALSATIGNLSAVRDFFFGPDESADFLQFPATRTIEAQIRIPQSPNDLRKLFVRLMDAPRRKLLVFVKSRKACEALAGELQHAPKLASLVFTHYSSLSTDLREQTERQFAEFPCAICIATSTLEIGIDIGDIDAVVLMNTPPNIASFLQRIGRSNRRSHRTSVICLCENEAGECREALIFSTLLQLGGDGVMPIAKPQQLWGAVAQQCLSFIQQEEGAFTQISELTAEVSALPHIDRAAVEKILSELASAELLQKHGFQNRYGAADGLWDMEKNKMLFGNFPLSSQTIDLRSGKQLLGSVPRYNLIRLGPGAKVRFASRVWRVQRVDSAAVELEPSTDGKDVFDLAYGGSRASGLDSFHADALHRSLYQLDEATSCMSASTWALIGPLLLRIRECADAGSIPFERSSDVFRHFTFAGQLANKVIANWFGDGALAESDLTITSKEPLDWSQLPVDPNSLRRRVEEVFSPSTRQTVFQQRLPLDLQREEWLQEWIADESVSTVLERLQAATSQEVSFGVFSWLLASKKK